MITRREVLRAMAGTPIALAAQRAAAQEDRQVITVFVGAASSMDFTARVIAEQCRRRSAARSTSTPSPVPASGWRSARCGARRADGRTLVYATTGPFAIYPHIYTKLDYDPDRDFTPIGAIATFDVAIATGPKTGATTLKEMIAWARAQGPQAVFGSAPGNGSLSHFLGISVNLAADLKMTHVPYKDSGVGLIDLASARLPMMITGLSPQVELHKAGKIRSLAVSGEQRSPLVPDVPTLKEAGLNLSSSTSTGLFGPPRMAPELVQRIHAALQPIFSNAATQEKLAQQGMVPWQRTGAQLAASLVDERKRFEALVKASGMVPEAG